MNKINFAKPKIFSLQVKMSKHFILNKTLFCLSIVILGIICVNNTLAQTPVMVFVEGGTFKMGNDNSLAGNEKPAHFVTLNSFYISKYEITFAEYDAFCKATGWRLPTDDYHWGRGNRPVIDVTWYDAIKYCNWLSVKEGLTPAYDIDVRSTTWKLSCNFASDGYRLPTEAEWEYAARGGNVSNNYLYSGSVKVDDVAWYVGNSYNKTQPVGLKKPNELGIYDMNGNVFEWCWDWHDDKYYSSSPKENPIGPKSGTSRVLRGGSYNYLSSFSTVYQRYYAKPDHRSCFYGFRVVRTAK